MNRFVSPPLLLTTPEEDTEFSRADLVFYGVDHSGPSYEGRVFLNNPGADPLTPLEPTQGYAGSFHVFGHGDCYGDQGHCDPRAETRDEFDVRPPHPLSPLTLTVIITEALARMAVEEVTVTVVAVVPGPAGPEFTDAMAFERLRLLTYL